MLAATATATATATAAAAAAAAADEVFELVGPADGGFYFTKMMDWVLLNEDISPIACRLYGVMRSLCMEKRAPVRLLTIAELRQLLPSGNGKPYSRATIERMLANLKQQSLIEAVDGPTTGGPVRWRINDLPADPENYPGWRNSFAKLDHLRTGTPRDGLAPRACKTPRHPAQGGTSPVRGGTSPVRGGTSPELKNKALTRQNAAPNKSLKEALKPTNQASMPVGGQRPVPERVTAADDGWLVEPSTADRERGVSEPDRLPSVELPRVPVPETVRASGTEPTETAGTAGVQLLAALRAGDGGGLSATAVRFWAPFVTMLLTMISPARLVEQLTGGVAQTGGIVYRLRSLHEQHTRQAGQASRPGKPPHCGNSDCNPYTRILEPEHRPAIRCPRCHPSSMTPSPHQALTPPETAVDTSTRPVQYQDTDRRTETPMRVKQQEAEIPNKSRAAIAASRTTAFSPVEWVTDQQFRALSPGERSILNITAGQAEPNLNSFNRNSLNRIRQRLATLPVSSVFPPTSADPAGATEEDLVPSHAG